MKAVRGSTALYICAGLLVAGTVLQLLLGSIPAGLMAMPSGAILAAVYVYLLIGLFIMRDRLGAFAFFTDRAVCISSMASALAVVIIFGLTRQDPARGGLVGALGFSDMRHSWIFVLVMFYFMTSTGLAAMESFTHLKWSKLPSLLGHLCLFVIMICSFFGGGDRRSFRFTAVKDTPVMAEDMPFALVLREGHLEDYPPMNYVSQVDVMQRGGLERHSVSVNHPIKKGRWYIYQSGFEGEDNSVSVLQAERDRWWPISAVALWGLLLGGIAMMFIAPFRRRETSPAAGEAAAQTTGRSAKAGRIALIVFAAAYVVFISLNFIVPNFFNKHRVAALHSPWFTPHIVAYMAAYSIVGVALIYAIYLWIKHGGDNIPDRNMRTVDILTRVGWGLVTMGMTMGALWAKAAWGDWWAWDPKETWALATFLGYLLYLHIRRLYPKEKFWALCSLVFAFLLLQMCWYGVNYLPAAQGASIHMY